MVGWPPLDFAGTRSRDEAARRWEQLIRDEQPFMNDGPDIGGSGAPGLGHRRAAGEDAEHTPWSGQNLGREVALQPGRRWTETPLVVIPGSKSLTNRALLIAALARGRSAIGGILRSDDSYWCVNALETMGVAVAINGTTATVDGVNGQWPLSTGRIYVGSAGTVARFIPPSLCIAADREWRIDASEQMRRRPMAPLFSALTQLGARISFLGAPNHLPVLLSSTGLAGGELSVPGSRSSQFLSGVLIASPYARTPVTITVPDSIVQASYVRMTLSTMARFGVSATSSDSLRQISVPQGHYVARDITLEPDVSTAGYFMALAAVTGQRLRLPGVSEKTDQPDIGLLQILKRMGCHVASDAAGIEIEGPDTLAGGFTADMHEMSDQALTLAAMAVFADAPISITGVEHIRAHESDRIRAICENLSLLGIETQEKRDGLMVRPGPVTAARLDPHDDHRVAMSLSVIGARAPGIRIINPACVSKTFPEFYSRLKTLGVGVSFVP